MIKKIFAFFLILLLILNLLFFAMSKLEITIFWFNLMLLGGISYLFYREKLIKNK